MSIGLKLNFIVPVPPKKKNRPSWAVFLFIIAYFSLNIPLFRIDIVKNLPELRACPPNDRCDDNTDNKPGKARRHHLADFKLIIAILYANKISKKFIHN